MTWPTTLAAALPYNNHRAPCGCRYCVTMTDDEFTVHVSPNRFQRCFRHMKVPDGDVVAELLEPLRGVWDA